MENLVNIPDQFWRNKRVLITGNTGFKGSWLSIVLMEMGAKVFGYSLPLDTRNDFFKSLNLDKSSEKRGYSFHQYHGDVQDYELLKKIVLEVSPHVVFHLAAQPLVRASYEYPLETWSINVLGSLNLLESLKLINHHCSVVMATTDKVYENQEWDFGYRESDRLGGHDPYSASKAAAEIAIASWRKSFCGLNDNYQTSKLAIATARSGNVIGGGDWSIDRLIPDVIRAVSQGESVYIRNPNSTRPWIHVLETLHGDITLSKKLYADKSFAEAYNFGPKLQSTASVSELISIIFKYWPGSIIESQDVNSLHEANLLNLQVDKAYKHLQWSPLWNLDESVRRTVLWYRKVFDGSSALEMCLYDIKHYYSALYNLAAD